MRGAHAGAISARHSIAGRCNRRARKNQGRSDPNVGGDSHRRYPMTARVLCHRGWSALLDRSIQRIQYDEISQAIFDSCSRRSSYSFAWDLRSSLSWACSTAILRTPSTCWRRAERSCAITSRKFSSPQETAWTQSSRMRSSRRRECTRQVPRG
jgi:hypothetical protein